MHRLILSMVAVTAGATLAAGCGGGGNTSDSRAAVHEGAVVYRDALAENTGRWFENGRFIRFGDGRYQWRDVPVGTNPSSAPDALLSVKLPPGLAVSAAVDMREGAALRAISCRELGTSVNADDWYELGVDGRQALIRRMNAKAPPKVLARTAMTIPNGRRVQLTAQCVPDGDGGLVLALRVDGREVVRTTDPDPVPAARGFHTAGTGLRVYPRPDSPRPAGLDWDHFLVRQATLGGS
jgi:hypothetical protein